MGLCGCPSWSRRGERPRPRRTFRSNLRESLVLVRTVSTEASDFCKRSARKREVVKCCTSRMLKGEGMKTYAKIYRISTYLGSSFHKLTCCEVVVDPFLNPFAPGAGLRPPELAGRDKMLSEVDVALRRCLAGRSFRPVLFLGLRGTGKTVLLNEIAQRAEKFGFLVSSLEAPEDADLSKMLYPALKKVMRSLSAVELAKDLAVRALQGLRKFASNFKIEVDGVEVGLGNDPGFCNSGDLQTDLPELFETVGKSAQLAKKGWIICLDEVQYLSEGDLSALIVSCHKISQQGLPVMFVGAGLPQLAKLSGDSKSYAERLFMYYDVGALDREAAVDAIQKPLRDVNATISPAALNEIINKTKGYPFFIQQWAFCTWDVADRPCIDIEDVREASVEATHVLDNGFFRVRLDRLTKGELQYCKAMAKLGEGPYAAGKIADTLNKKVGHLGPMRAKIISKGMIYSTSYGYVDFTVPMFADFLRRMDQSS